jgi:hypothetical protein
MARRSHSGTRHADRGRARAQGPAARLAVRTPVSLSCRHAYPAQPDSRIRARLCPGGKSVHESESTRLHRTAPCAEESHPGTDSGVRRPRSHAAPRARSIAPSGGIALRQRRKVLERFGVQPQIGSSQLRSASPGRRPRVLGAPERLRRDYFPRGLCNTLRPQRSGWHDCFSGQRPSGSPARRTGVDCGITAEAVVL